MLSTNVSVVTSNLLVPPDHLDFLVTKQFVFVSGCFICLISRWKPNATYVLCSLCEAINRPVYYNYWAVFGKMLHQLIFAPFSISSRLCTSTKNASPVIRGLLIFLTVSWWPNKSWSWRRTSLKSFLFWNWTRAKPMARFVSLVYPMQVPDLTEFLRMLPQCFFCDRPFEVRNKYRPFPTFRLFTKLMRTFGKLCSEQ